MTLSDLKSQPNEMRRIDALVCTYCVWAAQTPTRCVLHVDRLVVHENNHFMHSSAEIRHEQLELVKCSCYDDKGFLFIVNFFLLFSDQIEFLVCVQSVRIAYGKVESKINCWNNINKTHSAYLQSVSELNQGIYLHLCPHITPDRE